MRTTRRLATRSANRQGFTLIELLIVVVIIGILAAVAIPKFSNTKDKANISNMKSDLKNLLTTQESFYSDSNKYGSKTSLTGAPYNFVLSNGGVVTDITGDSTGWSATITNPAVKSVAACAIYSGSGTAASKDQIANVTTQDGVPGCK